MAEDKSTKTQAKKEPKAASTKAATQKAASSGAAQKTTASKSKAAQQKSTAPRKAAPKADAKKSGTRASQKGATQSRAASQKSASRTEQVKSASSKKNTQQQKPEIAGRSVARYVRISPFKVRPVADKVRNMSVNDALTALAYIERACVVEVEKVIKSAAANAYQAKGFRPEDLMIAEIMVDEGPTIKRFRPRAKGAASRINRRTSHISVSVCPGKEA